MQVPAGALRHSADDAPRRSLTQASSPARTDEGGVVTQTRIRTTHRRSFAPGEATATGLQIGIVFSNIQSSGFTVAWVLTSAVLRAGHHKGSGPFFHPRSPMMLTGALRLIDDLLNTDSMLTATGNDLGSFTHSIQPIGYVDGGRSVARGRNPVSRAGSGTVRATWSSGQSGRSQVSGDGDRGLPPTGHAGCLSGQP